MKKYATTRFMPVAGAKAYLRNGVEAIPSQAYYQITPESKTGAIDFGDVGLMRPPHELNPKEDDIYRQDSWTPKSPIITPEYTPTPISDAQYKELSKIFGEFPRVNIDDIYRLSEADPQNELPPNLQKLNDRFWQWVVNDDNSFRDRHRDFFNERSRRNYHLQYIDKLAAALPRPKLSNLRASIPLDEKSLRDYSARADARSWRAKLDEFGSPIRTKKRINEIKRDILSPTEGGDSPSRIWDILSNSLTQEFGRNVRTGYLNGRAGYNEPDYDAYLREVNDFLNKRKETPATYKTSQGTATQLASIPSDYLEIKKRGLVPLTEYGGAIYPRGAPDLGKGLNDVFGRNAIPYEKLEDKMAALDELWNQLHKR